MRFYVLFIKRLSFYYFLVSFYLSLTCPRCSSRQIPRCLLPFIIVSLSIFLYYLLPFPMASFLISSISIYIYIFLHTILHSTPILYISIIVACISSTLLHASYTYTIFSFFVYFSILFLLFFNVLAAAPDIITT